MVSVARGESHSEKILSTSITSVDWLTGGDRHETAKERIYEAAAMLMASRGLDRLSIDDIATRAGCSRATVYRHVGGKDAILDAVLIRAIGRVVQSVRESVKSLTGQDRVVAAVLLSLRAVRADPIFAALAKTAPSTVLLDQTLVTSPQLPATAAELTGLRGDDPLAPQWIVRVVLALLLWPAPDADMEEAMVRRFVAPAFT